VKNDGSVHHPFLLDGESVHPDRPHVRVHQEGMHRPFPASPVVKDKSANQKPIDGHAVLDQPEAAAERFNGWTPCRFIRHALQEKIEELLLALHRAFAYQTDILDSQRRKRGYFLRGFSLLNYRAGWSPDLELGRNTEDRPTALFSLHVSNALAEEELHEHDTQRVDV